MKVNQKTSLKKWWKDVLRKYLQEICAVDQDFVKNPDVTVEAFLKTKGGKLVDFVRYEVGEGMEKREENFADEVKGQMK